MIKERKWQLPLHKLQIGYYHLLPRNRPGDKGKQCLPSVNNGAIGRLARILLDIARNSSCSQEQNQDHLPND